MLVRALYPLPKRRSMTGTGHVMTDIHEYLLSGTTPAISVRHCGAGPLVVFLHGIGGNARNWDQQLRALSPNYTAVAWDMRGYGNSEDYEGPLLLDDLCLDLLRLLDEFSAQAFYIVGLSMGGMIAQEFYRRHPRRVRGMLLANTNVGIGAAFSQSEKDEFVRLRKQPLLQGKNPVDLVVDIREKLLGLNPPVSAVEAISYSIATLHKTSYIKAIEAIVEFDSSDITAHIQVPVLLVASTHDQVTPLASMRSMHQIIPASQLYVFDGVGHLSNLERPEEFNELMLDFLALA